MDEFPDLVTVKNQDDYWLPKYEMTEREFRKKVYKWGPKDSQYKKDYQAVKRKTTPVVGNFYTYIAHKLSRNTLIVDEAHSLLGTLQTMAAKTIWKHEYNYPDNVRSVKDLLDWINGFRKLDTKLKRLKLALESTKPSTVVKLTTDRYRGDTRYCIKLIPMSVADVPSPFWNNKVDKIVLMSATIGAKDIEMMGLSNHKVLYIDVPSSIPVERRPILYQPIGNMSYANQDLNLPLVAADLLALANHHTGKGFIHAPYELAMKLRKYLDDDRFIFHNHDNKKDKYRKFYDLPANSKAVMIGSGMTEGLDLKYEVAEWQAIIKVPYPSLADDAMRYIAENDPDYYNWYVAKDLMQASGRICRSPDDDGYTYILDSQFETWYNKYKGALPRWFSDAVENM
jgi:Rad3-related DNA helicase